MVKARQNGGRLWGAAQEVPIKDSGKMQSEKHNGKRGQFAAGDEKRGGQSKNQSQIEKTTQKKKANS